MISKAKSMGLAGINGYPVDVEVDISFGLPKYLLVGLPDACAKESRERVEGAIRNSGFVFPNKKLIINLAPATAKKEGSMYDLAIAVGILMANGDVDVEKSEEFVFIGELGLDGELRAIKGVLPILVSAVSEGVKKVIVPEGNAHEAGFVQGLTIFSASKLRDVVDALNGVNVSRITKIEKRDFNQVQASAKYSLDLKYVRGQFIAKRALEIAAAGGHNILLIGPPGSGKTMLAKCFPTILPDLSFEESLEASKIHSIAGTLDVKSGILATRPFRTPHHTASVVALAGGGQHSKPGEISLAHHGVLFLDEVPEYPRSSLEMLRQPLEDNTITIARSHATVEYPASFTLIASMNPCPCGNHGSRTQRCTCKPLAVSKYLSRLSGPLMDRIDLHIEVDNVTYDDLATKGLGESSADVQARVNQARALQLGRFSLDGVYCNAKMSDVDIKKICEIDDNCEKIMRDAFSKLGLSARAYTRILKVARTIADLEGSNNIKPEHITEAVSYRALDRRYQ